MSSLANYRCLYCYHCYIFLLHVKSVRISTNRGTHMNICLKQGGSVSPFYKKVINKNLIGTWNKIQEGHWDYNIDEMNYIAIEKESL